MVKTRRGIPFGSLRNKKGHPIYSREDIREQYCITRKELDVLEHSFRHSTTNRLFGCLSTSHLPDSHCNKSSFLLLSCVQRRKDSSDADEDSDTGTGTKQINKTVSSLRKEVDDEDSSDGGFKQRITAAQPITRTVKRIECFENNVGTDRQHWRQSAAGNQRPQLDKTYSSLDSDQRSGWQMGSPLKRPTQLYFADNGEKPLNQSNTSHSVDELTDNDLLWKGSRLAHTPETQDDGRPGLGKKHVTFAPAHLVRSATVGGINTIQGSTPTQPYNERLVNGSLVIRKGDSIDSLDQRSLQMSRMADAMPAYRAAIRRAVMKTQATQTDPALKKSIHRTVRRSLPAYLTLSPRTTNPMANYGLYSQSCDSDDEEDILQISINDNKIKKLTKLKSGHEKRIRTRRKTRAASKTSPKTAMHSIDIQTDLSELGFHRLDSAQEREDLVSKSSTDSNQVKSESEAISSQTNELDSSYRSAESSRESTTIISEVNNSLIDGEDKRQLIDDNSDDLEASDVTKRPLVVGPKKVGTNSLTSFTSPESDNYSFVQDNKSPTPEAGQGSTSPPVDNIDSGGSSQYVSATDASPQVDKDKTSGHTSYETASSGSRFSSPPSIEQNQCQSSTLCQQMPDIMQSSQTQPLKTSALMEPSDPSLNHMDVICVGERTQSPESVASTHNSTEHNIEDFDSEDVGDVTPIQDISTDTSTAFEASTVVENAPKLPTLKPQIPPKPTFLLGDRKINVTDKALQKSDSTVEVSAVGGSAEEEYQSDDNESDVIDDVSGGDFIIGRNRSGELSTVSEVSEEISTNGRSYNGHDQAKIQNSSSETGEEALSGSNSIAESTTSGSFMIDGNLTEPNSLCETIERPTIEKSGSFPSIMSDNIDKSFPIDNVIIVNETNDQTSEDYSDIKADENQSNAMKSTDSSESSAQNMMTSELSQADKATDHQTDHRIDHQLDHQSPAHPPIEQTITCDGDSQSPSIEESMNVLTFRQVVTNNRQFDVHRRREMSKKPRTQSCDLSRPPIFTCEEWRAIVKRRSRSLSKSPEKSSSRGSERSDSCDKHRFTCNHCGERADELSVPSLTINKNVFPFSNFKSLSIDTTYHNQEDDEDIGIHTECYRSALWLYIRKKDEMSVWDHKSNKKRKKSQDDSQVNGGSATKVGSDDESTPAERQFRRQYQSVTHRMIHRRASIEMYRRALDKNFAVEKEIAITRSNGEFGFRIHGSRPVVVSAIEKGMYRLVVSPSLPLIVYYLTGTPAESCGLDVGDIVITINGTNVMEWSHSEVVKLAHSGADTLKLEVVSTRSAFEREVKDEKTVNSRDIIINGYLDKVLTTSDHKKAVKHRWFELKSDNCLYWYKSTKEMDPLGAICLQGCVARSAPELSTEDMFAFRIIGPKTNDRYFATKDKDSVSQWVSAINQRAIQLNGADPYIELTLNNFNRSAKSLEPNDCSGYLAIFSQRRKVWRNRYFILKDGSLYLYFDSNAKTSLGVFFLHGYRVQSCVLIAKKNTFEAIPPENRFRHLWFMAESDVDKKRWLSALEYSIDRWIKI